MRASRTFKYGAHDVTIETGVIARQADGAVLVNMADTVVLVTAVGDKKDVAGRDFFPLTVNYQEKTYAAGKIPGGFFKREGRPSEKETLTSRLIDRPIRPLFPAGYRRDVQVIATVLSMNTEIDPDIPALLGASAALALSGLPFMGPIAAARVGYKDGQYLLNPTSAELEQSKLDLVVAGTQDAVLMVESQADRLPEDVMLGAVMFGHQHMQVAIEAIRSLAKEVGPCADRVDGARRGQGFGVGHRQVHPGDHGRLRHRREASPLREDRGAQEAVRRRAHGSRGQHLDAGANRRRVP